MRNGVRLQAHKGVECEFPENTMPSFEAAVKQGYEMIELDLGVTRDDKIIVIHDEAINRTARNPDGSVLESTVNISDITYEEALRYDFGIWKGPSFAGTKIPLFADVVDLAVKNSIQLKIDNKIQRFPEKHLNRLFEMLEESKVQSIISCWSMESAKYVMKRFPGAEISVSFDGVTEESELRKLAEIVEHDRLSIWIPIDFEMATWAPRAWFATADKCEIISKYAKIGIWAIKDLASFERAAAAYHPWAAETTGTIKPE